MNAMPRKIARLLLLLPALGCRNVPREEFPVLAARARAADNVRFTGVEWQGDPAFPSYFASRLAQVQSKIEIWCRDGAVKHLRTDPEGYRHFRLYNGREYHLVQFLGHVMLGGRGILPTPEARFKNLERAAFLLDAVHGYAELTALAAFKPAQRPRGARSGSFQWFELEPTTVPRFFLLEARHRLWLGLDTRDGLVRQIIAEFPENPEDPHSKILRRVSFIERVERGTVQPADMMLPPEAEAAQWRDWPTDSIIQAPIEVIRRKEQKAQ